MKRACEIIAVLGLALPLLVQAAELADPTRPVTLNAPSPPGTAVQAAPSSSTLRLEGIVLAAERRVAIINGKLLHVGDWLGDAHIQAIDNATVLYSRAGRSHTLRLAAPAIQVRRRTASSEAKP